MGRQAISLGTVANDGTGTPLRTGGDYINQNFIELYGAVGKAVANTGYLFPENISGNGSAALSTVTNSFAVYLPMLVVEPISIDKQGLYVTAGQATAKVNGYIYDSTNGGKPGASIQNMGEIAIGASTGFLETTALGTPKALVPGLYWACWHVFGINPQISTQRINASNGKYLGVSSPSGALAANTLPRYLIETGITYQTPNANPTVASGSANDGIVTTWHRSA